MASGPPSDSQTRSQGHAPPYISITTIILDRNMLSRFRRHRASSCIESRPLAPLDRFPGPSWRTGPNIYGGAWAKKWFTRSILYQIRMSLAQNLGKWIAITLYFPLFRLSSPIGHTAGWKAEILAWIGHLANYGSRL